MSLSVVIPVFGAEENLRALVHRMQLLLRYQPFELVLVNDGSRDRSWQLICELAGEHAWIRGINLMRNYGQHNALLCGIRAARYETIVTMDDDLQNPPEEVPRLLARLDEGYDVVYGMPRQETHGVLRNLASRITKMALKSAMGAETARHVSAFRAFRTQLRNGFERYSSPFVSIDVLLTWSAQRFTAIDVEHRPRLAGVSHYTLAKLLAHAINMMTGFSVLPLQLASFTGFAFTLFGGGVLVFVLLRYLTQGSGVPGFAFLASVIAIFSGAQLFALGIIGEYLARMHFRSMERPTYVVRGETAGTGSQSAGAR